MASRIVIRHITGVKANQIDQIDLEGLVELTIGRDPTCNMVFESLRDDYVSRRHAAIRIENGDHFKLIDLDSRNGTLLNGNAVRGEVELSPADIIELGSEGPKFSFDVQPRPAHFMARTRMLPKGVGATRVVMPSDTSASKPAAVATSPVAATPAEPVQRTIGRNTVIGMMVAQQSRTNRNWMYILAGALLIIAAGGGGLYYHNKTEADYAAAELDKQAEELRAQKATAAAEAAKQAAALKAQKEAAERGVQKAKEDTQLAIKSAVGVSPREIARKYGNAVVMVELQWRLFDRSSGKQLYHRAITVKDRRVPAYIHVGKQQVRALANDGR
jgi:pSer/pThr/pTyr-binding forkhead associated (FHA) protein